MSTSIRRLMRMAVITALIGTFMVAIAPGASAAPLAGAAEVANGPSRVPSAVFVDDIGRRGLGLQVTWNPSPVGQQVTGYVVTVTPVNRNPVAGCTPERAVRTVTSANTLAIVTDLCARALYRATVAARNSVGLGAASDPSAPTAPLTAQSPRAPLVTGVVSRDRAAVVSWNAPGDDGGRAVTGYLVTARPSDGGAVRTVLTDAGARTATPAGLSNGVRYAVTVSAVNGVGNSPVSKGSVVPNPAHAPGRPRAVSANPDGRGAVNVSWSPPVDDGGAAVTVYGVTWQRAERSAGSGWTPIDGAPVHRTSVAGDVTQLSASQFERADAAYLFSVSARNSVGGSQLSRTDTGVNPKVTIKQNAVTLASTTLAELDAATPTTLVWNSPVPAQVTALQAGKVIVAGAGNRLAPQGLLRRVTRTSTSGGRTTLTTTAASLDDVLASGGLSTRLNPGSASGQSSGSASARPSKSGRATFQPSVAGVAGVDTAAAAAAATAASATFAVDLAVSDSEGSVSGSISVTPEFSVAVDAGFFGVQVDASASVATTTGVTVKFNGEKKVPIGQYVGPTFTVPVATVPVTITPKIQFYVSFSGKIGFTVSTTSTIGAAMSWDSGDPTVLNGTNTSSSPTASATPEVGVEASGTFGITIKAIAELYGIGGPTFSSTLDLTATTHAPVDPGENYFTLSANLGFSLGLELDIFVYTASVEASLGALSYDLLTIAGPPALYYIDPANPAIPPGTKGFQFSASRQPAGGGVVTWSLEGETSGDSITSKGVLTLGPTPGRTLSVIATDGVATGRTDVTVGDQFDPPSSVSANYDEPTGTLANIAFAAPAKTGSGTITGYDILANGVYTRVGNTGSAQISVDSRPNPTTVQVFALNSAGQRSPAGSALLVNSRAAQVAVGVESSCAVITDGTLQCWGRNDHGQLGNGTTTDSATPVTVERIGGLDWTSVSGGISDSTCAIRSDQTVWCWGSNASAQLGHLPQTASDQHLTPVQVPGVSAYQVEVGVYSACALGAANGGQVWCWGRDTHGQIGTGSYGGQRAPVVVITGVQSMAVGQISACAANESTVYCWGFDNGRGSLGNGNNGSPSATPTPTGGFDAPAGYRALAVGIGHGCSLTSGQAFCWGGGLAGGEPNRTGYPQKVTGMNVQAAAGSGIASCLLSSGQVFCWGASEALANGETEDSTSPAAPVVGISDAQSISAGGSNACAVVSDGGIRCWGSNYYGELGNGVEDDRVDTVYRTPQKVVGIGA